MSFDEVVLAPWVLWLGALLAVGFVLLALQQRPWRTLIEDSALQHRWLGATVAIALMWQMRAQAVDWLTLHLVFTALMTLLFKAPLALITNVLVNGAMIAIGRNDWPLLGVNILVTGVIPALVVVVVWRLVDRYLPDHLMVYIFVCGFFGSALATLAGGLTVVLAVWAGTTSPDAFYLAQEYARFLPLLMPSEALITGMLFSIMVVYRPEWVATLNGHRYIDTK
ncbi:energy-coupling factor ABC transporter permease [Halomonas sp. Bachu 37]|uniref:energy-coupling factor ABC transporter permease n=1 Tax=Halomonas kashgarensis TaxID=3084920 RepID=UPI0032179AD5